MELLAETFKGMCSAVNTSSSYKSQQGIFLHIWRDCLKLEDLEVRNKGITPHELGLVAVIYTMTHSYTSLKPFLSAVGSYSKSVGFGKLPTNDPTYRAIKKGMFDTLGVADLSYKRLEITASDLLQFRAELDMDILADARQWAMHLVHYYGALRISELIKMVWEDIIIWDDGVTIEVFFSKYQKIRTRTKVKARGDWMCLKVALLNYKRLLKKEKRPPPMEKRAPLWVFKEEARRPLGLSSVRWRRRGKSFYWRMVKRDYYQKQIKRQVITVLGLDGERYASHSIRRGRYMDLRGGNVPQIIADRVGRWSMATDPSTDYFSLSERSAQTIADCDLIHTPLVFAW